ncbi:hypothetical protein Mgra_00009454 [Meloidogyne graminicola]|uniref:Uncharacterized protein n=1 Tax=Meloidogyne graminicola TaxID=189291 RepID=A0A8S9ZDB4_9BILA|nr:hypothetical protein Mgra_00009454 [Meloidogyne graminicola]
MKFNLILFIALFCLISTEIIKINAQMMFNDAEYSENPSKVFIRRGRQACCCCCSHGNFFSIKYLASPKDDFSFNRVVHTSIILKNKIYALFRQKSANRQKHFHLSEKAVHF